MTRPTDADRKAAAAQYILRFAWTLRDSGNSFAAESIENAVNELQSETQRSAADMIPNTWLDPLLTGPNAVIKGPGPYTGTDIENLMRALRKRLSVGLQREEKP